MAKTIEELTADLASAEAERDDLKGQLKASNDEAKGHRLNANKFKGQLETLQSELDTATNKLGESTTKHAAEMERQKLDLTAQINVARADLDQRINADREDRTNGMLLEAACKLGLGDPDYLKLFDRTDLRVGEDGTVENPDAALAAFKAAKPHFFTAARGIGTATGYTASQRQAPTPTPNAPVDARKMTKEDAAALRREITSGRYTIT